MTKEEIIKHNEKLKAELLYRKEHWDEIIAEIFEKLDYQFVDDSLMKKEFKTLL